jgi:hypothetical protein
MAAQVMAAAHGDILKDNCIPGCLCAELLLDWLYSPPKQTNGYTNKQIQVF